MFTHDHADNSSLFPHNIKSLAISSYRELRTFRNT